MKEEKNIIAKEPSTEKKTNKFASAFKKTASAIQNATKSFVEKKKENNKEKQMKKLNPLFPEQYRSADFHLPNVIKIVDDAVRRDNELCKGAIGWTERVDGVEVLFLYDEWVEESGIQFVPVWKCDNIYYVDAFDRNKYIDAMGVFSKTNEEKLAELGDIAQDLGAKYYSIEIVESDETVDKQKVKSKVQVSSASVAVNSSNENKVTAWQENRKHAKLNGHNNPKYPKLKWFVHDNNITSLIKKRCEDVSSIKEQELILQGSTCLTMNQNTACAIDKLRGIKGDASIEKQAKKEHSSKLVFHIEF